MTFIEFKKLLLDAELTIPKFTALIKVSEKNIQAYKKKKEVPNAIASIAACFAKMNQEGMDYKTLINDLDLKKKELADISAETEKEEEKLTKKSDKARKSIEERLIVAYDRLRNNSKNGLAVVSVERDSCGGCFNKIPPQRQLDIQARKKLIVCEHCGRILVEPLGDA